MGSEFLDSSVIFFRSIALFSRFIPIDKEGTHSACWVPFSKRSFRVEYKSVSASCSGELLEGITSFKTLDSQFCFQMRSISSTVQYVDLNIASLRWYLKKQQQQRLLRLPGWKKARVKSPFSLIAIASHCTMLSWCKGLWGDQWIHVKSSEMDRAELTQKGKETLA